MNQSTNNIDNTQPQMPNSGENLSGENTRFFTKEQVNKIVEERLKKEKIKTGALKDLKNAVMNLYKRGYFDKYKDVLGKNLSLSDMAGILSEEINKLGEAETDSSEPEIADSAAYWQDTPEKNIMQASQNPPPVQPNAKQPPEWSTNPKIFELFAQNKNLPMENILNDYLKFVVQVERAGNVQQARQVESPNAGIEAGKFTDTLNYFNNDNYNNAEHMMGTKNQDMFNIMRSGYNSISPAQSHRTGENFTLTERQKELARAGGMTYREYHEFINSIPTKKLKK